MNMPVDQAMKFRNMANAQPMEAMRVAQGVPNPMTGMPSPLGPQQAPMAPQAPSRSGKPRGGKKFKFSLSPSQLKKKKKQYTTV